MSQSVLTRTAPDFSPASLVGRSIPNRYAGQCKACGQRVQALEGRAVAQPAGWVVVHLTSLACMEALDAITPAPAAPEAPTTPDVTPEPVQDSFDVVDEAVSEALIVSDSGQIYNGMAPGTYTLDGETGHHTFRIRVQRTDAKFAPGKTIIQFLAGPDNESDYVSFGFLSGAYLTPWRRFQEPGYAKIISAASEMLAHPERALVARECIRCGRLLTTSESLARGLGPTCADKGW